MRNANQYFAESYIPETTRYAHAMRYMTGSKDPGKGFGIITSENPFGKPLSTEENKKLLDELKNELDSKQISYKEQWGRYGYDEKSLFVFDIDIMELLDLAKRYKQASYIWGVREKDGTMSFAYIDAEKEDIEDIKYRVDTGLEAQSREDYISAFWYKVKKKGSKEAQYFFRKYFVPFFSDDERKKMGV